LVCICQTSFDFRHLPASSQTYQKPMADGHHGRTSRMRKMLLAFVAAGAMVLSGQAFAADYKIMAPAAPGGGWDQTARTIQTAMQDEKISGSVQVVNVPGAGGTIGLAQFANSAKGDPSQLIVGGYVMVGAILTNASPVTLDQVTPIARLTGEIHGRSRREAEGRSRCCFLGWRVRGRH
jgi:hypothetical protein